MIPSKIYSLFQQTIENYNKNVVLKTISGKNVQGSEKIFRVIISFKDTLIREEFISKHDFLEILNKFDLIPSIITNLNLQQIQDLQGDDLIIRIEEDQKLYLSIQEVNEVIGLNYYKKRKFSITGKNIIVGIVDNGINGNVESISNVVINHYRLKNDEADKEDVKKEEHAHGTIMASVIANQYLDRFNNKMGIAPDVKIIDLDISNSTEEFYISNVLEMFDLITNKNIKIDVLLLSLTSMDASDGNDILSIACNHLVDKGIIIICPAGNNGPDQYSIGTPSAAAKVITIGALTKKRKIASFSGRGPTLDERIKPDFCLPGYDIQLPLSRKKIATVSGTCVAASVCAGVIALIKEFNHDSTHIDILKLLRKASFKLKQDATSQGHGMFRVSNIINELFSIKENTCSYNFLIRRSLIISAGFIIFLLFLFYLPLIINYITDF